MSLITKYILFQILIVAPFIAGYFLKNKFRDVEALTKKLIGINLATIDPIIVLWSIWGLSISLKLILLPISGIVIVLIGMLLGYVLVNFLSLEEKSRATFLISSSMANHGFTMGGFICYLLLGETGLGLSMIFISYFMPYLILFIFPYAKISSKISNYKENFVRNFIFNLQNMPIYSVILALIFHAFDFKRPDFNFPVTLFLMISISIYYFSLGTSFSFDGLTKIIKENIFLASLKFLIIPITVYFLLKTVNLTSSLKAVIFIQSFMPAAVYSVISSILFDLDSKLASGLFIFNTVVFITIVLPILILFKNIILTI
ncbi:MAG: AEC family transporter [Spirochaetota bacterium]|nr:AEC family transporter [Spirochaetota bacterium]